MITKFPFNSTWIKTVPYKVTENWHVSKIAQWQFTLVAQAFLKPVTTSYSPARELAAIAL